MTLKNIGKFTYIIKNRYKFTLYTDGYTISDIVFIPLEDGKYMIEDKCLPYIVDETQKIGRRTEQKAMHILKRHLDLLV